MPRDVSLGLTRMCQPSWQVSINDNNLGPQERELVFDMIEGENVKGVNGHMATCMFKNEVKLLSYDCGSAHPTKCWPISFIALPTSTNSIIFFSITIGTCRSASELSLSLP